MAVARTLFESADLYFAELVCPPNDPEWGEENLVTHPIVALPATPVWQAHDGAAPTLMNANHAVFHHDGSEYHRERFEGRGYRCLFFFPADALVREIAAELDASAAETDVYRFPARTAPLEASVFATSRRLAAELIAGVDHSLWAREALYAILRCAVRAAYRQRGARAAVRQGTARAHTQLVEDAKEVITRTVEESIGMDDLAGAVHASPYHLARTFRRVTGYSLHGYQTQLRLREGLDRLERSEPGAVGRVATDLGFSSHSHFTASFRQAFGVRPSAIRARS